MIVEFEQKDRQNSENLNNDTFCTLSVTGAQGIQGTDENPVAGISISCDDDDCFQGYGEFKEAFRALTKDDILWPYVSDHDFRSVIDGIDVGYNIYVFGTRFQKNSILLTNKSRVWIWLFGFYCYKVLCISFNEKNDFC